VSNNKKTIGFLCSSLSLGGLEMNTIKLASWMKERGWPIKIYLVKGTKLDHYSKPYELPISYIRKHKKYYDYPAAFKLYQQMKSDGISYLWFRDNRDMSLAAIISFFSARKIKIVYQQAMLLGIVKKDIFHRIRYSRLDAWVTLLPSMAKQVQHFTDFNTYKIHTIPIAIDTKRFANNFLNKEDARWELELPKNKFIVGVIGRIDPKKGQKIVIEALNQIINENIHVAFIGDVTEGEGENYLNGLKDLIKKYNLDDKVHFIAHHKDVEVAYKALDVFVMSSEAETFGSVTIEAMASAIPIVATNSGGTPDIISDNKTGVLFPPKNSKLLAEKISLLYNDEEFRNKLRKEAQQEAIDQYSHHQICIQVEKLLKTL